MIRLRLIFGIVLTVLFFQNCQKGFETVDLASNGDDSLVRKFASPFATSKVSLKSAGSQQKAGIAQKVSDDSQLVDPTQLLAILIDNACAGNESLFTRVDAFDGLIHVNFARKNDKLKVQAYEASVKGQASIAQLKSALDKDSCVIGLTNNGLASVGLAFGDIGKAQDHHRAIHTVQAYQDGFRALDQAPLVKVAIVDTGADVTHPDLQGLFWSNAQGDKVIDFTTEANSLDQNGHGTHVTGLIAGRFNSTLGAVGVASNVRIMSLKALDKDGSGMITDIVNAILYAVDNNADVINMSLGGGWNLTDDLYLEAFRYAANKNIPVIVAAGNENEELHAFGFHAPADMGQFPGIVVVGSVHSSTLERSPFSNFGAIVDVSAPGSYAQGTCVLSTLPVTPSKYGDKYSSSPGYGSLCGTSMATPIVTGAAALVIQSLKAKKISYSSQTIETILAQNSQTGKAPDLGRNNVLDLDRLALYLNSVSDLPADLRGLEVENPLGLYLANLYMNILYRKYDDAGFHHWLQALTARTISLLEINRSFIDSDEFKNSGIISGLSDGDVAYARLFLNILGRNPTAAEIQKIQYDFGVTPAQAPNHGDLIAALLVQPEALTVLQNLKVEGAPVFDEDRGLTAQQVTTRHRKRVLAFSYFKNKFSRLPLLKDIQAVSSSLDSMSPEAAIDFVFKSEPSDLTEFIISQYMNILDRHRDQVSKLEIDAVRAQILSQQLSRDSFISSLKNSDEKKIRDIYKQYTITPPFLYQVSDLITGLQNGTKTWDAVRSEIQQQVGSSNNSYISTEVDSLLIRYLLRTPMNSAKPPFKLNDEERGIWAARFRAVQNWAQVESEMAARPEAIAYKLYLNTVGRTVSEIMADYDPVLSTISLLQAGQSEASVRETLSNSDEKFVRDLYRSYLLKTPGLTELYGYLNGLKSGKYSRDSIKTYLQGRSRSPDLSLTPAPTQTPAPTPTPTPEVPKQVQSNHDFLLAQYKAILDRTDDEIAKDAAGFNYWLSALDQAQVSRADLQTTFQNSNEFFLRQTYKTELHRRADFAGLLYWIREMDAGRATKASVVAEFKRTCTQHIGGECP